MALAQLLEAVGVPGSIAIMAAALLAFYRFRDILHVLSRIGTYAQIVAFFAVILVAAMVGLIPGVDLTVMVDQFIGGMSEAVDGLVRLFGVVLS